jgi:tetratricopeptide (TPR) repeat protein
MPGEGAVSGSRLIPMSLNTFQFELKRRWKILKEEQTALAKAYHIFVGKKEVWPDQCKNTLALLYRIESPVRELRVLLENPANLPDSVVQQRHLLLMAIQHTDEQNQVLIEHITEFRAQCQSPSKQTTKKRQEIEHELYVFVREYDEVVNSIASLLDQTRFQGKKPMPLELQRGELSEALDYLEKALLIVREVGDDRLEEQVLDNISIVCNHLRWLEEAKIHIEQALEAMQEIADRLQDGRKQWLKFV